MAGNAWIKNVLAVFVVLTSANPGWACEPPRISKASTVQTVTAALRAQPKKIVTFLGYSGAEYEDKKAMLARATAVLDTLDPRNIIVNIGATTDGIGAVYAIAKVKGFETTGIVSTQARDTNTTLAPCVDTVYFVRDTTWGGFIDRTSQLSPTSEAMVAVSDQLIAIGGGEVARDEFNAAKRLGKKTQFFPADMSHAIARERAVKKGQPSPTDFRGALGAAVAGSGAT